MTTAKKFIGINQRVPFQVLDEAISEYLASGTIDKVRILAHMKEFTKGENRALKATSYAFQVISRQSKLLAQFKKTVDQSTYLRMRISDRKALVLCFISLTYPIAYDLLVAMAAGFKVQNQINKTFINHKISTIYGSNRTMDIALDALLPMVVELGAIQRDKISLYSQPGKLQVDNPFISEVAVYTDIKLSGSKSILLDDVSHRPWYLYFDMVPIKKTSNILLKYADGPLGGGYLSI